MVQTPTTQITLEAFLKLPETKPASEYIDGKIIQKHKPQGKHSTVQTDFSTTINLSLKPKKVARAFTELRCTFGGRSIIPDIAVFTWNHIPRDEKGQIANTFSLAPDWTIEILSPDQNQTKVIKNILHCLKHGTEMGWLIDPDELAIFVYRSQQETQIFDQVNQVITVPDFAQDLTLTVQDILTWLLD
ncbi:MAG: Uma2 family endonuclease [Microcystaceae cyanobacterium]